MFVSNDTNSLSVIYNVRDLVNTNVSDSTSISIFWNSFPVPIDLVWLFVNRFRNVFIVLRKPIPITIIIQTYKNMALPNSHNVGDNHSVCRYVGNSEGCYSLL